MDVVEIYQCLCDRTRLRILNILAQGPLCVCHVQAVLGEPQVKISKHLGYLKTRGAVAVRREGYWRIYRLSDNPSSILQANLACLQDASAEDKIFARDRAKLRTVLAAQNDNSPLCCTGAKSCGPKSC
jgi:ArsR family transcriptional regulator